MASAISNTNTTVSNTSNTTTSNPKAQLQSQDFMKLLLVELQYQDPTSPMDTDKMLTQTSQLATLEAQNATKDAMTKMTTAFQTSANYSLASAIGKMADTGLSGLNVTNGSGGTFDVYLPTDTSSSVVSIVDSVGNVYKTFSYDAKTKGTFSIKWDGSDSAGNKVKDGVYTAKVEYTDTNGNAGKTTIGAYPIESLKVDGSTAYFKVGSQYIDVTKIKEIF
ncbi:MAG: flagellar hook capping protein [Campylobacteraceae bacterium]|jgi:flagellar basal-body rod modification protein FlgD|nr:flagellar hook capping protein [Campylobacteraceae bacterium]